MGTDVLPIEQLSWRTAPDGGGSLWCGHALEEFLRLLSIAGMQAPVSSAYDVLRDQQRQQHGQKQKEEGQRALSDHFLHKLGINPSSADVTADPTPLKSKRQLLEFFGRMQPQSW